MLVILITILFFPDLPTFFLHFHLIYLSIYSNGQYYLFNPWSHIQSMWFKHEFIVIYIRFKLKSKFKLKLVYIFSISLQQFIIFHSLTIDLWHIYDLQVWIWILWKCLETTFLELWYSKYSKLSNVPRSFLDCYN